jgi:hypothetical protein
MSARKKSTPSSTRRPAQSSTQKLAAKSNSKGAASRRSDGNQLPDIGAIVFAFADAQALVTVAHKLIVDGDNYGPEEGVLRLGVEALDRISNQLDEAEMQLGRFRRRNSGA